jgi:hypothetical protein
MFPSGSPGFALLLLRASVALALLLQDYGHRHELPVWGQVAALLISLVLLAGYATPIAALIALALHGFVWFNFGAYSLALVLIDSLDAIALALLGPGAYSVDSYRFGRRVVILPPS